jgi:hypothetical protein
VLLFLIRLSVVRLTPIWKATCLAVRKGRVSRANSARAAAFRLFAGASFFGVFIMCFPFDPAGLPTVAGGQMKQKNTLWQGRKQGVPFSTP